MALLVIAGGEWLQWKQETICWHTQQKNKEKKTGDSKVFPL